MYTLNCSRRDPSSSSVCAVFYGGRRQHKGKEGGGETRELLFLERKWPRGSPFQGWTDRPRFFCPAFCEASSKPKCCCPLYSKRGHLIADDALGELVRVSGQRTWKHWKKEIWQIDFLSYAHVRTVLSYLSLNEGNHSKRLDSDPFLPMYTNILAFCFFQSRLASSVTARAPPASSPTSPVPSTGP